MSNYIRPRAPGAFVFFTVNLAERGANLLVDRIDLLREAVSVTKAERPFEIAAWVVLPDHMHAIWRMPEGDADYSVRWRLINARFSQGVPMGRRRESHVERGERGIWQRRFWDERCPGNDSGDRFNRERA